MQCTHLQPHGTPCGVNGGVHVFRGVPRRDHSPVEMPVAEIELHDGHVPFGKQRGICNSGIGTAVAVEVGPLMFVSMM